MISEDRHPAIIDKESFDLVQKLRQNKRRQTNTGKVGLFSGLVHCEECRFKHYFCAAKSISENDEHCVCSGFRMKNTGCSNSHFIRQVVLTEYVLADLNANTAFVAKFENLFIEKVTEYSKAKLHNLLQQAQVDLREKKSLQ